MARSAAGQEQLTENNEEIAIRPDFFKGLPQELTDIICGYLDIQSFAAYYSINKNARASAEDGFKTIVRIRVENILELKSKITASLEEKNTQELQKKLKASQNELLDLMARICRYGNRAFAQICINGLKKVDVDLGEYVQEEEQQAIPLYVAAKYGNLAVVNCLIENGADVYAGISSSQDSRGVQYEPNTIPLYAAITTLNTDIVKALFPLDQDTVHSLTALRHHTFSRTYSLKGQENKDDAAEQKEQERQRSLKRLEIAIFLAPKLEEYDKRTDYYEIKNIFLGAVENKDWEFADGLVDYVTHPEQDKPIRLGTLNNMVKNLMLFDLTIQQDVNAVRNFELLIKAIMRRAPRNTNDADSYSSDYLLAAVKNNNVTFAKILLEQGANPFYQYPKEWGYQAANIAEGKLGDRETKPYSEEMNAVLAPYRKQREDLNEFVDLIIRDIFKLFPLQSSSQTDMGAL